VSRKTSLQNKEIKSTTFWRIRMALNTLKNIEKIGQFAVIEMDKLREKNPEKFNESGAMDYKWFEKDIRPNNFIYVRHDVNSISFTTRDVKPLALAMGSESIWLNSRKLDRESRNVEGTDQK